MCVTCSLQGFISKLPIPASRPHPGQVLMIRTGQKKDDRRKSKKEKAREGIGRSEVKTK